jgi:quinol-cytochrome oxidoreductase complex cytochrome b subunit
VALIRAALTLLVLRLLRRMRPLLLPYVVWAVRRLRGEGPVSDLMETVLVVVAILGFSVAVVGLIVVAVMAALGHGHGGVPEAAVLVPFCVGVGARVVLWAMGRDEFPFSGDGGT